MNRLLRLVVYKVLIAVQLFSATMVCAQKASPDAKKLRNLFTKKVTNVHQEKVFVHTDRSVYISGETIWFSLYCVDASFHFPSTISKVLNIEILNDRGISIKKERIELTNGFGDGQIFVSPDIPTGKYILRSYTNWMKNFDPDLVGLTELTIINPSKKPGLHTESEEQILIDFFPEGGYMVNGLKSKITVMATGISGDGRNLEGAILDDEDKVVANFATSSYGYASFYFTPEKGKVYRAITIKENASIGYDFPIAKENGLVMEVSSTAMGTYNVAINSTEQHVQKKFLVVHTRGIINSIEEFDINRQKNIVLETEEWPSGITHITILDDNFSPLAERLVFKFPDVENLVKLKLDKHEYTKREEVTLSLAWLKEVDSKPERLSLSVYRTDSLYQLRNNIVSDLLLTSDIKGKVMDPWRFFDPENKHPSKEIDLIMSSNGWRRFEWEDMVLDTAFSAQYPAEMNAPILSGEFFVDEGNATSSRLQIVFLGKSSVMSSTQVDDNGMFRFEVPFHVENDMVYFYMSNDTLSSSQIVLEDPFNMGHENIENLQLSISPDSRDYLQGLNANIQVSQIYRQHNYINGLDRKSSMSKGHFYGQPDHEYRLDDYTRFETIEDLFIEYIRTAKIRKTGTEQEFYMINEYNLLYESALAMIDGVPILDTDYILNFDPLKIEKVELVNESYHVGGVNYGGFINFITYNGDFDDQDLPDYLVEKAYHALQSKREFYAPSYPDSKERLNRIPDYRTTLYWNPDLIIDQGQTSSISFYTSDDIGTYQVEVNGITSAGDLINRQAEFTVEEGTR